MQVMGLAALEPVAGYNCSQVQGVGFKMRVMILVMIAAVFSILAIKFSESSFSGGRLTASPSEVALG